MLAHVHRRTFFDLLRPILGVRSWTQAQVNGLERLLANFERDPLVPAGQAGIRRVAYWLYTSWHETGHTFTPIEERGGYQYFVRNYGGQTAKGRRLGNDTPEEGDAYHGRGDVQLTGETNYEQLEALVREHYPWIVEEFERETGREFDLTIGDQPDDADDPKGALYPAVSYVALVAGTTFGLFGPGVGKYLTASKADYFNARRSVNVLDHADRWRDTCPKIEHALERAIAAGLDDSDHLAAAPVRSDEPAAPTLLADTAGAAGSSPAVVAEAGSMVQVAAPVETPAAPVVGGALTDDAVKANKQSLITKLTAWFGGGTLVSLVADKVTLVTGFSPEAQVWIVKGVLVLAAIAGILAAIDHFQTKWTKSRPDLQNTK